MVRTVVTPKDETNTSGYRFLSESVEGKLKYLTIWVSLCTSLNKFIKDGSSDLLYVYLGGRSLSHF